MPIATDPENKAAVKEWLKTRNKYMTGFCNIGSCEGQKPRSNGGKPLPSCPMIESCPCECHYRIDQMFEMTGMERVEMRNPDYVPDLGNFVMPVVEYEAPVAVAATPAGVMAPLDAEQPVAANVATPSAPLAERRGPSGVSVKGGLEARVWLALQSNEMKFAREPVTPKLIGEWMVTQYSIPTPSSGAIREVFIRWEKLGFAEWAQKPNRFVKFTGDGSWEELAQLKAKAKRQQTAAQTAASRRIR